MSFVRVLGELRPPVISLSLVIMLATVFAGNAMAVDEAKRDVVHQLRIYQIFDDTKQLFHDRFRDHAARIMARYDFKIISMWETRHGDRTEFVYLLEWPDEATMKDRWEKFMADEEWSEIKKQTRKYGPMVGEIQDRTLVLTDYSPQRVLETASE